MPLLRRRSLIGILLGLLGLLGGGPVAAAQESPSLSDAEKRAVLIDVIERFVPHAEDYWRVESNPEARWTGWFDAAGPGVTQPRGGGNIALAYATLLVAKPDQASFGGVPRAVLLDHAIQTIRHEAYTNVLVGGSWGGGTWQAALETYNWGQAANLLWAQLDDDTREIVRRVVVGEADILLTKPPATASAGDTGAEDNAWNAPLPALAAVMFPEHPNRAAWEERTQLLAINASSRAADESSSEAVDGRPVADWVETVNLFDDFTLENHGFFNPIYLQVTHLLLGDAAVIYGKAGHAVPEALEFRHDEVWEQVLAPLAADDGDLVMPAGQDWTSKDYQHLAYLSILATRGGRADASVAESRALELVARRQGTHDNGSILDQPRLGYESHLIQRLTLAWWTHELFGPSPQPSLEEYERVRDQSEGVHEFEQVDAIAARQRDALVSMSWDDTRPTGLVTVGATGHADDPIFSAYVPRSLIGSATGAIGPHACDCRERFFSTAGTIGQRSFSMTAFPDGVTLLLDRGEGRTFNFAFEAIPGVTGARPVHSEGGTGLGALEGSWGNVADRFGLGVAGGAGLEAREVASGNPHLLLEGSRGTGSGNRVAAAYPLVSAEQTRRLSERLQQPQSPEGWSALLARAPDGTARLAVGRWGGPDSATLELADPRGAPVVERPTTIEGTAATARWRLDAPSSTGETVHFFVEASGPLEAEALDARRVRLTNDLDRTLTATVTHVDGAGQQRTRTRVLAAGESVVARLVDGELVVAGPEWEPLTAAARELADLRSKLDAWRASRQLSVAEYLRLRAAEGLVSSVVYRAIEDVEASRPDTTGAARAVELARLFAGQLRSNAVPPEVGRSLDESRERIRALLGEALAAGLTVTARVTLLDELIPGEPARVRTTIVNRGGAAATQAELQVVAPDGWQVEPDRVDLGDIAPGETRSPVVEVRPPVHAEAETLARFEARLAYRVLAERRSLSSEAEALVVPLLSIESVESRLPLAAGGWNRAEFVIANRAQRPLDVTLSAHAPGAVDATVSDPTVTIPAGGTQTTAVELRNTGLTAGQSELILRAATGDGREGSAGVELLHSENVALNPPRTPWPRISASSHQANFPADLANDGDQGTFWVAAGTQAGDGPSPERPQFLTVDFGATLDVDLVSVVPRVGFGPRAYAIEVSQDGQTWTQVAAVPSAPNTTHTTTFAATQARQLRIAITDSHDRIRPPRNVQVAELVVSAAG